MNKNENILLAGTAYRFVIGLQESSDVRQMWALFTRGIRDTADIPEAQLVYRAGVFFESMGFDGGGITHNTLTSFSFAEFQGESDFKVQGKKVIVYKLWEAFCGQITYQTAKPLGEDDPALSRLVELTRIYLNHLFLVLRIKNFEFSSVKDDITMAYNQNYLKAFIQNEMERARRYASVFSIVFFDLDNLKAINEVHGHLVGTEVLKEVAQLLRMQVRKIDVLSRFGGDEFVIVLLNADERRANDVCLRIRDALRKHVFLEKQDIEIHITGCFGISSFPAHGNTVEELIRKADLAMYHVKRKGKDGIKLYHDDIEKEIEKEIDKDIDKEKGDQ